MFGEKPAQHFDNFLKLPVETVARTEFRKKIRFSFYFLSGAWLGAGRAEPAPFISTVFIHVGMSPERTVQNPRTLWGLRFDPKHLTNPDRKIYHVGRPLRID